MKKILFILFVFTGLMSCKMGEKKAIVSPGVVTTIEWLDPNPLTLGEVTDGQVVEVAFHFKNTGDKPLVIKDVVPGCGCTDAEKPEGAVAPGEKGVVKAKFNSKGYSGRMASKSITVTANTDPQQYVLNFNVQVK